jgi:hypothetical protein
MQLLPSSPSENGSAKCRSIGVLALTRRGLRILGAAASAGGLEAFSTGCAVCCGDGSHIGMTWTTGGGALGAAGGISGNGVDGTGFAR